MVGHAVRRAGLLQRGIADNAVADLALAVPVCILDKIEQPDRAPRRIIVLLPLAALVAGVRARCGARHVRQWVCTRFGGIAGNRIVSSNIAPGTGVLGKAGERCVCDIVIDFAVGAVIDDLVIEFRDKDHRIVGRPGESGLTFLVRHCAVDDVVFLHALPRHECVEWRAASACADGSARLRGHGGIDIAVRVVARRQARKSRRGIAVRPADAEDRHEYARHRAGLACRRVVVRVAGNGNRDRNRAGVFIDAVDGHNISRNGNTGNIGAVGYSCDRSCAKPCDRERVCQFSIFQLDRGLAERQ